MKELLTISAVCALFFMGVLNTQAETLAVSSSSEMPGYTVTLTATLGDNTNGVAGAAFTLNYDTSVLSLSDVRSSFFPLFSAQSITPSTVDVDGVTYDKALVVNPAGTMIASARVDNGPTGDQIIYEFDLTVDGSAPLGDYPIEIIASTITNPNAGYATPTEIPILIGISADGLSYPERTVTSPTSAGTITVGLVDSDEDGIDDNWEKANVPADTPAGTELDVFNANTDNEGGTGDGYSALQEYLNRGEPDPLGAAYDPLVANAPYGTGYDSSSFDVNFLPSIYQLLLGKQSD